MAAVEVKDMTGVIMKVGVDVGGFVIPSLQSTPEESKRNFHKLTDFKFREDDILICTYQKTGTNWLYEIISMINNRSAERITTSKLTAMIDLLPREEIDKIPSPRVLCCHLPFRYLPKDINDSKVKIVLCFRNPKDTAVSFYNHTKQMRRINYNGKFTDWLPVYLQGKLQYGKYTDYIKEWERAINVGVRFPLHVLYYEDLKLNGMKELDRLLEFLDVNVDEETKNDILDACDFEKMAKEKTLVVKDTIEKVFHHGFNFFRKGQIGDWKNWFTVSQDEMFDEVWKREMKDSKMFKFIYPDPRVSEQDEVLQ